MQPMLTGSHLAALANESGPWVTICMPLHRGGPDVRQDTIRFRNLVREIKRQLESRATESERVEPLIEPLQALESDRDVFNAGARGLVVFASPARIEHWHLPVEIDEVAVVDERPHLEPVLPIVTSSAHFYVIALSMHQVRLLECSRFVVRELPLPEGTPTRLEEAAGWEFAEVGYKNKGGASEMLVGQGGAGDDREVDIRKFVRDLDAGLWQAITHRNSPVVLACSERVEKVFREQTRLPNVVTPTLHGNYEHVSDADLHAKAWALIEPQIEARIDEALERFRSLQSGGLATSQIEQIVQAAAQGRIDTLFLDRTAKIEGTFDSETHSVKLGEGGTDLLEQSASDAFLTGATVHVLEPERMPVDAVAAAILRY